MDSNLKHLLVSLYIWIVVLALLVYWSRSEASPTEPVETVVQGQEIEWTHYDEFNKIYEQTTPTEKQEVVQQVSHKVIHGKNYTIEVWLGGWRKNINPLKWLTIEERSKEWLDHHWMWDTYPIWIEMEKKHKINHILPICVAWADSHLWKALATSYNLGNVGNNDRWDRVHMKSWEQWIEAIYKTLNNRYFSTINEVGRLSGEWRIKMKVNWCVGRWDYCYATSTVVWDTNVRNCMSAIADAQVDLYFNFRI